ncbi:TonB-dependent receptor [uncultured Sphingobacterium sp.]|uniref:TonB-dependent receptor n=1 Tax=uncultured Sphingobacterium sp. TaxID=182688 RepID=UPI0025E73140|nr:TonB-dependent receptor [uncultured Sphingobacterium sp.]
MKKSVKTLLLMLMHVNGYALTQQADKSIDHVRFKQLVKSIEQRSDYRFVYDPNEINPDLPVDVNLNNVNIPELLRQAFSAKGIRYQIVKNTIVLQGKGAAKAFQMTISGRVSNGSGAALEGVSVRVKNKVASTMTDANGRFSLNGLQQDDILLLSYVGYRSKEVKVADKALMEISLELDPGNLDEVVVIGYGTSSIRKNTGSVSSVTSREIETQPVLDPLAALQGRVAGLNIASNSGLPGSSFQVQLRGVNSLTNGSSPLYIIDGIPFSDESMNQFTAANGNQSPLSLINPKDIERIDVLKDADATAIYGSRGGNGVILITTKRGNKSGLKIDFNANVGSGKAIHNLKMLNTAQYLDIRKEGFKNDNWTATADNAPDLLTWDQSAYSDWQKEFYGASAPFSTYQLSFSGGNENTQYLASANFNRQGDPLPGNKNYQRGGALLNLSTQSKDQRFKLNSSFNLNLDRNNTVPTDIAQFYNLAPNYPLYDEKGGYYWFQQSLQNPAAYMERSSVSKSKSLLANFSAEYAILPELVAKVNVGYNLKSMDQTRLLPNAGFNPLTSTGSMASYGNSDYQSYIVEPQINYSKTFGKHDFKLLLGGTWQQRVSEGKYFDGSSYPSDSQLNNIGAAGILVNRNNQYADYRYQSAFGRINYAYADKYLLNFSYRRDGSSRFGPNNKYGNFGSIGAAWVFSSEEFLQDQSIVSFGKLRASWGVTGNDQIGDYQYLDTWGTGFAYQGITGLYPTRVFNPNFGWEEIKKKELGLDLGFFRDRIFLTANYYNNRSDNQLINIVLAPQTGYNSYFGNTPALIENKGLELELSSVNIQKEKFSWKTNFNITFPSNTLLEYPGLESSSDARRYIIGESTRIVRGFQFTGVDSQTGVAQFRDVDGDGKISDFNDYVTLGSLLPKYYGGIGNNLSYGNVSLGFLFQFVKQEGPSIGYGPQATTIGGLGNLDEYVLNRWQQPGDVTDVPRATANSANEANLAYRNYYRYSSAVWDDASFIRLKNVSLSYDISKWAKKINMSRAVVQFNAQNLFTWTSFRGMDPEMPGFDRTYVSDVNPFGSVRNSATPSMRTYTFAVQLTF